jgi:hypothetical protein
MAEGRDPSTARLAAGLRRALDTPAPDRAAHPDDGVFARYLSGELTGTALDEFEGHAARCAACAEDLVSAARSGVATAASALEAPIGNAPAREGPVGNRPVARASDTTLARAPRRVGRARRSWFRIAAMLVIALSALLATVAGGRLVLARVQPAIVAGLEGTLKRPVEVERVSLALGGGLGLHVAGLRIGEDPAFGKQSFAEVGDAAVHLDSGALLHGRLVGSLRFDQPVVRLMRDQQGRWNVAGLGGARLDRGGPVVEERPESRASEARPSASGPKTAPTERRVALASASVRDGTLQLTDLLGKGTTPGATLVMQGVNANYSSPDPEKAAQVSLRASLEGRDGAIDLAGEIGPFTGSTPPHYVLSRVEMSHVPLAAIPGSPPSLSGALTFHGSLESAGNGLDSVLAAASGGGDLRLEHGSLGQQNLAGELVAKLARGPRAGAGAPGASGIPEDVLASLPFATALLAKDTVFDQLASAVRLEPDGLRLADATLDAAWLHAQASGSFTRAGVLDLRGTAVVPAAIAAALVPLVPELRSLLDESGALRVPFVVAGAWPKAGLRIDTDRLVADAARASGTLRFGLGTRSLLADDREVLPALVPLNRHRRA